MLRHPDFLYAFDVRGLYFHANLITEISTKVKSKKLPGNYSRQSCVFYSAILSGVCSAIGGSFLRARKRDFP